ncbi:MAG TPA: CHAD domain-containing protein [Planctomycetaceae bacterium]|nr:CHAD domain-containing protein [Planctomycetaceae bacterium]
MAFRFKTDESIGKGVRRTIRREIEKAISELNQPDQEEAVHEPRKRFKKIRAVLRLVREDIGNKVYRRENRLFRDAARPLTEARDSTVLLGALDKLAEQFGDQASPEVFSRAKQHLEDNQRTVHDRVLEQENAISKVSETVGDALKRLPDWADGRIGRSVLRCGLKRVYKQAYQAFVTASADPQPENLHEWRKQSKYFLHQLQVLKAIWPEGLDELGKKFKDLVDLLGDYRDLFLLRSQVNSDRDLCGGHDAVDALLRLIDRRSGQLQEAAFALGRRIYGEGPKSFAIRTRSADFVMK